MGPGDVVGGRFVLQRFVGAGGMGAVHAALDRETGGTVALKVLRAASSEAMTRFVREARVLAELDHPAIVRYVASGDRDGVPYLAMEWLAGADLARRLERSALTVRESVALARRVADALALAHARGLVHRDVKPANLFLVGDAPEDVKVLDFGIARDVRASARATETGAVVGTLGYLAPEQARGDRLVSARADVFALGCVLFECLTGTPAFAGANPVAVLAKILVEPAPRLRDVRPDLPGGLDDLLDRMLAKDPEGRPADGAAVRDELAAFVDFEGRAPMIRPLAAAPVHSSQEQQFVTIVHVSPGDGSDSSETLVADGTMADDAGLIQLAARSGAMCEALADGSLLFAFAGASMATDRAAAAARIALAAHRAYPSRRVAAATGRAATGQRLPVGEALDRTAALLAAKGVEGPAGVRIDEVTAGLLRGRFEVVEGEGGPIVVGESSADAEPKLLGRPTPCVGRERELRMLEATADEAFESRTPAAVLVIADAGVGKSRLEQELTRRLRARAPNLAVWRTHGTPLSSGSPLAMIATLLRRVAEVADDDPPEVRRAKIVARVRQHVREPHVARVSAFLGEILGARFPTEATPELASARVDPREMTRAVHRAWDEFLAAETAAHPVMLVLEDLHWGDRPTVDVVGASLGAEQRPLFVLALARPSVVDTFGEVWRDHGVQELRLRELPRRASADLARHVLGRVDDALLDAIVHRAGGNAFFLEEILRSVAASGAQPGRELELPETVIAMLGSRLAQLDDGSRRLLRAGSVFGATFWASSAAALLGTDARSPEVVDALAALVDDEMISRQLESRFRGEEEFAFRHALLRDAAYATFHPSDLRASHASAGAWLERQGEPDPRVLAEHFERGAVDDAGWAKAATYWNRAAAGAASASALTEAVAVGKRALAAVARIERPELRVPVELGIQLALGSAVSATRGYGSAEAAAAFDAARALAEPLGDGPEIFRALVGLHQVSQIQARYDDAVALGLRCLRIAERAQRPDLLLEAHRGRSSTCTFRGELAAAREHLDAGLALFDAARTRDAAVMVAAYPEVICLSFDGLVHALTGRAASARASIRRSIEFSAQKNHAFSEAHANSIGGAVAAALGDFPACAAHSARGLAIARERGMTWIGCICLAGLGHAQAQSGDAETGLANIDEALRGLRREKLELSSTALLAFRADAALALGKTSLARESLDEAADFEGRTGERFWQPERLRLLGVVEEREGRASLAEERLSESIEVARAASALTFELRSARTLCELRVRAGRTAEAAILLGSVYGRFTEGFEEPELLEARALLQAWAAR